MWYPDIQLDFEIDFQKYLRKRMYPPGYGKETKMPKLSHKHIFALTRAQNLLETAVNVQGQPKLDNAIHRDIILLGEVRQMLYFALENPTLSFTIEDSVNKPVAVNGDEEAG